MKKLWFKKSRRKWLAYGDKNTKFVHGATIVCRKRNSFVNLQDASGQRISSQYELERMITQYFMDLFLYSEVYKPFCLSGCFTSFDTGILESFSRKPSSEDIKNVICKMGDFKAPGKDELQVVFYQNKWLVVGPSLCDKRYS